MARQVLPVIWTSGDIDALKKRLKAAAKGTDETVQTCAAVGDAMRASWGQWYAAVLDWTNEPTGFFTTGSQANRGEAYEDELYAWQLKLQSTGCTLTVPAFNPQPAEPPGSSIVKWGAIAVVAVAGAYGVSKLVAVLPKIRLGARREAQASAGARMRARLAAKG